MADPVTLTVLLRLLLPCHQGQRMLLRSLGSIQMQAALCCFHLPLLLLPTQA
jgi:hypothetical protein